MQKKVQLSYTDHQSHSCRAGKNPYRHDSCADKDTYRHDGRVYSLSLYGLLLCEYISMKNLE